MLKLTTTYTFTDIMENAYSGAEDTLRVIAEHHKTDEFMDLVEELGYTPFSAETLYRMALRHTEEDFIELIKMSNRGKGFRALNDLLTYEPEVIYYHLNIPTDEDGEPLPYEE